MLRLLLFLLLRLLLHLCVSCSTQLERSNWWRGSSSYAAPNVYNIKLVDNLGCWLLGLYAFETVQIGVAATVSNHVASSRLPYWRLASSSVFRLGGVGIASASRLLVVLVLIGR